MKRFQTEVVKVFQVIASVVSGLTSPPPCQVYELEGVVQLHDAHFWTLYTGSYHGSLRLDVMAGTDMRRTLASARGILTQVGSQEVQPELYSPAASLLREMHNHIYIMPVL